MNTYVLLLYLAQFLLNTKLFSHTLYRKIKTHSLCAITIFRTSCRLKINVEKYDTAGEATDYNIIRRIQCIGSIIQTTHTDCEIIIAFSRREIVNRLRLNVPFIRLSCINNRDLN
jgi:hypothetical protein